LVLRDQEGKALKDFATPAELDALENLIFSLVSLDLDTFVTEKWRKSKVAIVVFASEYRNAAETVDGHHADLTLSTNRNRPCRHKRS